MQLLNIRQKQGLFRVIVHLFIFKYYIILMFLCRLVFLLNTYNVIKCINDYIYFAVIKLYRHNNVNVSYTLSPIN